jgi:phospholipid/cholesterol/gamma-HCH transport system substrate-binding protein
METRAHHVLIGLFTVIVVAGALLFGIWLVKSSSERAFNNYDIVFNESVTGLSRGGPVLYNGIKLGDVVQLRLDPTDSRRVLARIRVNGDTPLRKDTHAKLALTGVTGVAVIQLTGGSPGSPLLVGQDGAIPIIVADPSQLSKLFANGQDLVTNISLVMARAAELLSPANIQRINNTLDHLDKITGTVSDQRDDIKTLLQQLALASKQANATLAQAQDLIRTTNGLVGVQGKATLDSAEHAMASLERVTANIDQVINNNREAINGGVQGLGDLAPALRELRQSLDSLRSITRRLDDNPAGYLFGREKKKEFKP